MGDIKTHVEGFQKNLIDVVEPNIDLFLSAYFNILFKGLTDKKLREATLEMLKKEVHPRFFTLSATKSGSITNNFLSSKPGSEVYHILDMCLRLNRQLQMEPVLNIEYKPGFTAVSRSFFEQALTAVLLHDVFKCGSKDTFDSTKSEFGHGKLAAETFSKYAEKYNLSKDKIKHVSNAIKYHDGRFSPLLREKYRNSKKSLYEILLMETEDIVSTTLAYNVHSLDMLTSNGFFPPPTLDEINKKINYINNSLDYLKCAEDFG